TRTTCRRLDSRGAGSGAGRGACTAAGGGGDGTGSISSIQVTESGPPPAAPSASLSVTGSDRLSSRSSSPCSARVAAPAPRRTGRSSSRRAASRRWRGALPGVGSTRRGGSAASARQQPVHALQEGRGIGQRGARRQLGLLQEQVGQVGGAGLVGLGLQAADQRVLRVDLERGLALRHVLAGVAQQARE